MYEEAARAFDGLRSPIVPDFDLGEFTMTEQIERNRAAAIGFFEAALNRKDAKAALAFLGAKYRQHNPVIEDGAAGLAKMVNWLAEAFPQAHSEILRVVAEGNFVVLHVHRRRTPGGLGDAIVDIFRLEDGKLVEHWDVIQLVPESSVNSGTMF
jgi:predicted SnoaL-like aldol condensation-catalyzing enzyme